MSNKSLTIALVVLSGIQLHACSGQLKPSGTPLTQNIGSASKNTATETSDSLGQDYTGPLPDENLSPFQRTLHPILSNHCQQCHAKQSPTMATGNHLQDEETVLYLVNFQDPKNSHLVSRLSEDKHQCWSDCQENADSITRSLEDWASLDSTLQNISIEDDSQNTYDPSQDFEFELSAYKEYIHPIVEANCGKCHGDSKAISPWFALSEPKTAYLNTLKSAKIDHKHPENSRLVLRLSQDRHQCWDNCADNSLQMLDGIRKWAAVKTEIELRRKDSSFKLSAKSFHDAREMLAQTEDGILLLEAESGEMFGRYQIGSDSKSSGGKYIYTPRITEHPLDGFPRHSDSGVCSTRHPYASYDRNRFFVWEKRRHPDASSHRIYMTKIEATVLKPDGSGEPLLDSRGRAIELSNLVYLLPENHDLDQLNESNQYGANLPDSLFMPPFYRPADSTISQLLSENQRRHRIVPIFMNTINRYSRLRDQFNGLIETPNDIDQYLSYRVDMNGSDVDVHYGALDYREYAFTTEPSGLSQISRVLLNSDQYLDPTNLFGQNSQYGPLPEQQRTPGYARYSFRVTTAGLYTYWAKLRNGETDQIGRDHGVRLRDSRNNFIPMKWSNNLDGEIGYCDELDVGNASSWTWKSVFSGADDSVRRVWDLKPGNYTLEVIEDDTEAKIDLIGLADIRTQPHFNPLEQARDEGFISQIRPKKFIWDLSHSLLPGATFEIEVREFSASAYLLRNPKLTLPSGSPNVSVQEIGVLINGKQMATDRSFHNINRVVGPGMNIIQYSGLVVLKDHGPDADQFAITFKTLAPTTQSETLVLPDDPTPAVERPCLAFDYFEKKVMPLFKQIRLVDREAYNSWTSNYPVVNDMDLVTNPTLYTCTGCHNGNHNLFRMTAYDDQTLCQQALSRVDLNSFERSVLLRGVNGMFGHRILDYIEDVPETASGYQKVLRDGIPMQSDSGDKLAGQFIGLLDTYNWTPAEISAFSMQPGDEDLLYEYVNEPKRVGLNPMPDGGFEQVGDNYILNPLTPLDLTFSNPAESILYQRDEATGDFGQLKERYRATILEWMRLEKEAFTRD